MSGLAVASSWIHELATANPDIYLDLMEDGCVTKWKYYNLFLLFWSGATFLLTVAERQMGDNGKADEHLPLSVVRYSSYMH